MNNSKKFAYRGYKCLFSQLLALLVSLASSILLYGAVFFLISCCQFLRLPQILLESNFLVPTYSYSFPQSLLFSAPHPISVSCFQPTGSQALPIFHTASCSPTPRSIAFLLPCLSPSLLFFLQSRPLTQSVTIP